MDNAHRHPDAARAQAAPGVRRFHDPDRQGLVHRDRAARSPRSASRCTAAWASSRRPAPRSTCATRASPRSTKARPASRRTTSSAARRRATAGRRRASIAAEIEKVAAELASPSQPRSRRRSAHGSAGSERRARKAVDWIVPAYGSEHARRACRRRALSRAVGPRRRRLATRARGARGRAPACRRHRRCQASCPPRSRRLASTPTACCRAPPASRTRSPRAANRRSRIAAEQF